MPLKNKKVVERRERAARGRLSVHHLLSIILDGLFVEKGICSICVLIGKATVMCESFVQ